MPGASLSRLALSSGEVVVRRVQSRRVAPLASTNAAAVDRSAIKAAIERSRSSGVRARRMADGWKVARTGGPVLMAGRMSPRCSVIRKSRPRIAWAAVAPRQTRMSGRTISISRSSHGRHARISDAFGRSCRRRLPLGRHLKCLTTLLTKTVSRSTPPPLTHRRERGRPDRRTDGRPGPLCLRAAPRRASAEHARVPRRRRSESHAARDRRPRSRPLPCGPRRARPSAERGERGDREAGDRGGRPCSPHDAAGRPSGAPSAPMHDLAAGQQLAALVRPAGGPCSPGR